MSLASLTTANLEAIADDESRAQKCLWSLAQQVCPEITEYIADCMDGSAEEERKKALREASEGMIEIDGEKSEESEESEEQQGEYEEHEESEPSLAKIMEQDESEELLEESEEILEEPAESVEALEESKEYRTKLKEIMEKLEELGELIEEPAEFREPLIELVGILEEAKQPSEKPKAHSRGHEDLKDETFMKRPKEPFEAYEELTTGDGQVVEPDETEESVEEKEQQGRALEALIQPSEESETRLQEFEEQEESMTYSEDSEDFIEGSEEIDEEIDEPIDFVEEFKELAETMEAPVQSLKDPETLLEGLDEPRKSKVSTIKSKKSTDKLVFIVDKLSNHLKKSGAQQVHRMQDKSEVTIKESGEESSDESEGPEDPAESPEVSEEGVEELEVGDGGNHAESTNFEEIKQNRFEEQESVDVVVFPTELGEADDKSIIKPVHDCVLLLAKKIYPQYADRFEDCMDKYTT